MPRLNLAPALLHSAGFDEVIAVLLLCSWGPVRRGSQMPKPEQFVLSIDTS